MTDYNAVIIIQLCCGHAFIIESIGRVLYINNPGNTQMCMFAVSGLIVVGDSIQSFECSLTVLSGVGLQRSQLSWRWMQDVTLDFSTVGRSIHLQTQNPSHLESSSQRKREGIRLQPLKVRSGLLASINSLVIKCKHMNLL